MTISLFIAYLETENFTFEGVGASKDEAKKVLIDTLILHGTQYGLPDLWFEYYTQDDGVSIRELVSGKGYRDNESI